MRTGFVFVVALALALTVALGASPALADGPGPAAKWRVSAQVVQNATTAQPPMAVPHEVQPPKTYIRHLAAADQRFNEGKVGAALEIYKHLLDDDDTDTDVLQRVALARFKRGDFIGSGQAYKRTLELLGPPPYDSLRWVTNIFTGKRISADEHYHQVLARASRSWSYAGDHAQAVEAAEVVRERLPDEIAARHVLAQAYMHAGQPDESEVLYQEILELDPDNGTALNNLSTVRYLQRNLDGANELLERVLEQSRTPRLEAIALHNVAEIMMLEGDYDNAESHWLASMKADDKAAFPHFGLATLHNVQGNLDDALNEAITGWDKDKSGIDRKNEFFVDDEWRQQRDAMVAEAEGRFEDAWELWDAVAHGNVKRLVLPAKAHASRLDKLLSEEF